MSERKIPLVNRYLQLFCISLLTKNHYLGSLEEGLVLSTEQSRVSPEHASNYQINTLIYFVVSQEMRLHTQTNDEITWKAAAICSPSAKPSE